MKNRVLSDCNAKKSRAARASETVLVVWPTYKFSSIWLLVQKNVINLKSLKIMKISVLHFFYLYFLISAFQAFSLIPTMDLEEIY